jgi:hypothetical protein
MVIEASATKSGGSVRSGTATVTAVDSVAGTITVDSAAGITGFADDDFLYRQGDYDACISGVQSWLPFDNRATEIAAPFFSITRTANPTRQAGVVGDLSALPIEQAVSRALTLVEAEGGRPDYGFLGFEDFEDLRNALGAKVTYYEATTNSSQTKYGSIGFTGIKVFGSKGFVTILADRTVPSGRFHLMTMKSWKLRSLGPIVDLFDTDSLPFLRSNDADSIEIRMTSYANLVCRAPAWNGQFVLRT